MYLKLPTRSYSKTLASILTLFGVFSACGPEEISNQQPASENVSALDTPKGIYITSITAQRWRFEFYAGPAAAATTIEGELVSAANPTNFTSFNQESNDTLALAGTGRLHFTNNLSAYSDAFEVTYAVGQQVCLQLTGSAVPVFVGPLKQQVTPPFSLDTLAPCGTPPPTANAVKWHPGHYTVFASAEGKYNPTYRNSIYNELKQTPALRGVMVRYAWAELEKGKDVYDFSNISQILTELTALNKRLIILFELKASSPGSNEVIVPNYLKTAAYEGGSYAFSNNNLGTSLGYGIRLWNPAVHDRMNSLVRALGKEFNSHPNFEAIGFTETSMSEPVVPLSTSKLDTYFTNLLDINNETRVNFPNTMTFQFANWPRPVVKSYVESFKNTGIALGCPDVFIDDPGLWFPGSATSPPGVYKYYQQVTGNIPLVIQVENGNYENTRWDNTGYKPTVNALLKTARDDLNVNYLFWVRIPGYFPKVLTLLNETAQKSTPSGGLKSACPTVYSSCTN